MAIAGRDGDEVRMVRIHPLRACNLACRRCCTESGPLVADALPDALVARFVEDAAEAGYTWLEVGGGEPLLWNGLLAVLDRARAAGLRATVTTNATLLTPLLAHALAERVAYVTVGVDGPPRAHDSLRGAGSFRRMDAGLARLREAGAPFGVRWTLTRQNPGELEDVYAYARIVGAAFLRIHPLEAVGGGARELADVVPDEAELGVAGLLAAEIEREVPIYLDASPSAAPGVSSDADDAPLAALVSPLVLRADGVVVPGNQAWTELALGNVYDAPLPVLAERWRADDGLGRWRAPYVIGESSAFA